MSEIKVSKLTNRAGTGAPNFSQGIKISGTASTLLAPTRTESATEPTSPANGDTWYDTDNDTYDVYINDEWKRFIGASADTGPAWVGDRGLVGGGYRAGYTYSNVIDYFDITTSGNATDFGDLTVSRGYIAATGSSSRAVFGGGDSAGLTTIDYVTPSTTGNATDFGDHTTNKKDDDAAGNGTRGLFCGGQYDTTSADEIEYITIDTTGNATAFGDLTQQRHNCCAVANSTYCLQAGGYGGAPSYTGDGSIDYVTIDTTGNATDWGDLVGTNEHEMKSGSDENRGVMMGGYTSDRSNQIQYISLSSTGNASDFGDLLAAVSSGSATSNGTYATHMGGFVTGSGQSNVIQIVTIQTTGNASDHGDLTTTAQIAGATSGAAS